MKQSECIECTRVFSSYALHNYSHHSPPLSIDKNSLVVFRPKTTKPPLGRFGPLARPAFRFVSFRFVSHTSKLTPRTPTAPRSSSPCESTSASPWNRTQTLRKSLR